MTTGKLRNDIDKLWEGSWTGGIAARPPKSWRSLQAAGGVFVLRTEIERWC